MTDAMGNDRFHKGEDVKRMWSEDGEMV
jgi:hypothetical protein